MERPLRELVWQRAGNCCEYCQVPQSRDRLPFEIDHIIAEMHEGPTKAGNLCLCCFACNRPFRLPEAGDPMPATLAAMRLVQVAPELLEPAERIVQTKISGQGIPSTSATPPYG